MPYTLYVTSLTGNGISRSRWQTSSFRNFYRFGTGNSGFHAQKASVGVNSSRTQVNHIDVLCAVCARAKGHPTCLIYLEAGEENQGQCSAEISSRTCLLYQLHLKACPGDRERLTTQLLCRAWLSIHQAQWLEPELKEKCLASSLLPVVLLPEGRCWNSVGAL